MSEPLSVSNLVLPHFSQRHKVLSRDQQSRGNMASLKPFSFSLPPGKISFLLGPNGSGKSTLLKVLLGVLKPQAGSAKMSKLSASQRMQEVAWVDQDCSSELAFSVMQVIALSGGSKEQIQLALEKLQLQDLAYRSYSKLSGGEQKRVHLARAVAQNAQWLLLDEPFANLDLHHVIQLQKTLVELAERGASILLSTHDPNHLLNVPVHLQGDAIVLDQGALSHHGSIADRNGWVRAIENTFQLKQVDSQQSSSTTISFVNR